MAGEPNSLVVKRRVQGWLPNGAEFSTPALLFERLTPVAKVEGLIEGFVSVSATGSEELTGELNSPAKRWLNKVLTVSFIHVRVDRSNSVRHAYDGAHQKLGATVRWVSTGKM
eukprot:1194089-Prorocentrum_minimum.AAC.2